VPALNTRFQCRVTLHIPPLLLRAFSSPPSSTFYSFFSETPFLNFHRRSLDRSLVRVLHFQRGLEGPFRRTQARDSEALQKLFALFLELFFFLSFSFAPPNSTFVPSLWYSAFPGSLRASSKFFPGSFNAYFFCSMRFFFFLSFLFDTFFFLSPPFSRFPPLILLRGSRYYTFHAPSPFDIQSVIPLDPFMRPFLLSHPPLYCLYFLFPGAGFTLISIPTPSFLTTTLSPLERSPAWCCALLQLYKFGPIFLLCLPFC